MNTFTSLFVICLVISVCLCKPRKDYKSWSAKERNEWIIKMGYSTANWTTDVGGQTIPENALYKDGQNVIFVISKDELVEETTPELNVAKSFQIYDVNNGVSAISVKKDDHSFCFIIDEEARTMDEVKAHLETFDESDTPVVKGARTLYALSAETITSSDLREKSPMIGAICGRAARCNTAYKTQTAVPTETIVETWLTSNLYSLNEINMDFDPKTSPTCKGWGGKKGGMKKWRRKD